ncbi:putative immunity protein [Paenibacillus sp. GCM10027627]|uniref:putative immunity protein n=1 Tax=unclassified Paenibacillus TaxID=185978 RepID=UPI003644EC82
MNIDEYAWNKHEQKIKEQTKFSYSKPKIKIYDNTELRNKIEEELERLPQKLLSQWALKVATPYLDYLDNHLKDDPRINLGIETLEKRIEGSIRAYDLRKVGFTVNELAKESKSNVSKYSARSFAQAIATGHMRGHAMVSSDYAIKVVNTLTTGSLDASTNERERQIKLIEDSLFSSSSFI